MKTLLLTLPLLFPAFCQAETSFGAAPDPTHYSLTTDDLLFSFTDSKGIYELSPEERQLTMGKDMIIAGIFTDKRGWYQQISDDNRSYIGIERADATGFDTFSCAGGYVGTLTGGYQFVFNRAKPESTIGTAVILNDEATQYSTLIEEGAAFTLQRLEDALTAGRKAAISLLRTPKDYTNDMLGLSILVGEDEQGNHLFEDYVVACEIFSAGDDSTVKSVAYDPQRLTGGYYFVAPDNKTDFGMDDLLAANHYILAGDIPHPVPEPSAATLSLLALAGLMARRKRFCSI